MPTNHSRGGSSRAPRSNRDSNQKRSLNSKLPVVASGRSNWPSRSKFEHIPSISRSSGVEPDGDTLKDPHVQEEYREFLQQKLDAYWEQQHASVSSEESATQKSEIESNILIQFRKLREGISSSQRHDQFAIEAYETSLWLSVIFHSHAQTTSILSHLLPDLYLSATPLLKGEASSSLTALVASLHSLDLHYPSQGAFYDLLKSLSPSFPVRNEHRVWLPAPEIPDQTRSLRAGPDLALLSLQTLVTSLRDHLRLTAWRMIRSAYRELAPSLSDTSAWLSDVLLLETETGKREDRGESDCVQHWFISRESLGEVGRKDGPGRWVMKVKK
ncbi:hypothetical protein BJV78DRAFT_1285396 [Lactifluus subvellereus]|nr:hypothetical protein BJV78DRAFT_1285396 [Lactifluus subvellereus]